MDKWSAKGFTIYDKGTGLRIALVDNKGWSNERAEAHAKLIVATPELYRIVKVLYDYMDDYDLDSDTEDYICEILKFINGKQEVKE